MSDLSINTEQKYLLDGVKYNAPEGWEDVTIQAEYVNDNIQPSLTVSEYSFPLEAREAILNWFHNGVGGFEGMPFELILYNNQAQQKSFKSFLDFTSNYQELLQDGRVTVGTIKEDNIDELHSKLEAVTFGYLEAIGAVTQADYTIQEYVVEKKFNLLELLITSITLYLMIKELAESIERTSDAIADVTGLSLFVGVGSTALGVVFLTIAKAIIAIAYTAILLIAIINLAQSLINSLVSPIREHRIILLRNELEVVATHLGYG